NGISGSNTARAELLAVSGKVDIMDWKPRAIVLAYQSPGNAMLLVRQFYFPGWSALLDGRLVPVSPSAEGLVLIPIPSGHHSVRLSLLRGLAERTGIIASQISLIILLGLGMRLFGNNATIWKSEKNP
ncbi:MAG TPA: hypothetical protein VFC07_07915, partial [Verrucomicrobiae bacterium]|nr:hypothetical protein [Verrucomicrobiae bacterium]